MWQRLLRLLASGINAYSFYTHPLRFVIGILCVILVPYLAYLFWGTLIILALAVAGIYFIYKAIKSANSRSEGYY